MRYYKVTFVHRQKCRYCYYALYTDKNAAIAIMAIGHINNHLSRGGDQFNETQLNW